MKKVAFVIIRYGQEVNGGAEVHCRMLAEKLQSDYDIEVLTTTVKNFDDASQDYQGGGGAENGITVRRFDRESSSAKDNKKYMELYRASKAGRRVRYALYRLGLLRYVAALHPRWSYNIEAEKRFLEYDSCHSASLIRYLKENHERYDVLIFLNTFFSVELIGGAAAPEKSILIPMAHSQKVFFYSLHTHLFTRVRHIAFNTDSERRLCRKTFGPFMSPSSVVGVGIETAPEAEWPAVRGKYRLPEVYVLYLGRITLDKINDLIPVFQQYKATCDSPAKLVLTGEVSTWVKIPDDANIITTGFVSDQEKIAIIRHATLMVNPSHLESLSLLMLEAMDNRIPVLVNGNCEVMRNHCRQSKAAICYFGPKDFCRKMKQLLSDAELRRKLGNKGPEYVAQNYSWAVIVSKMHRIIDSI